MNGGRDAVEWKYKETIEFCNHYVRTCAKTAGTKFASIFDNCIGFFNCCFIIALKKTQPKLKKNHPVRVKN